MSKLSIHLCGVPLKNPVIAASGTYGYGADFIEFYPVSEIGAISCKGTTLHEKQGNMPPRIAETPSGMLNSVGLQNPGVQMLMKSYLPRLLKQGATVIANIAGNSVEDYVKMAETLADSGAAILELNISCPNVKAGGIGFGTNAKSVEQVTSAVKKVCGSKPLMVKLTPNVTDIAEMAAAAETAGADALSLINTLTGMRIDIKTRRPILHNNTGGLSGPAIFPVAVHMVRQVYKRVHIPIVGMGGIASAEDAIEMMMAGASAVQVGTANFRDPYVMVKIIEGLKQYAEQENLGCISELVGVAEEWA